MKSRVIFLLLTVVVWAAVAAAQQLVGSGKTDPSAVKAVTPAKTTPAAKTPVYRPKAVKPLDADQAYKANCSRCHLEPRKFSERKMATIMRHMQVRANMTAEEAQAVLRYLTK